MDWVPPGSWPRRVPEVSVASLIERGRGHPGGDHGNDPAVPPSAAGQTSQELLDWSATVSKALLLALADGNLSLVRTSLEQKADPSARVAKDGTTALHLAISAGGAEAVHRLLWAKARATVANRAGVTPLDMAVRLGDGKCLAALLLDGGPGIWRSLEKSERALSDTTVVALSGICDPPNADDLQMMTNLFMLKRAAAKTGFVGLGLDVNADVFRKYLFLGVARGWVGGVVALLQMRLDPNATDAKSGRTAVEFAVAVVDHRCTGALREHGGLEILNPGHSEWALCMAAATCSRRALDHWCSAADPDWQGDDGCTALMYAAGEGWWYGAEKLINDAKASPVLKDAGGRTAAQIARERHHHSLADWLETVASTWKGDRRPAYLGDLLITKDDADLAVNKAARPKPSPQHREWQDIQAIAAEIRGKSEAFDPTASEDHRSVIAEKSVRSYGPNVDAHALQMVIIAVRKLPTTWTTTLDPVVKVRLARAGSRALGPIVAQTTALRDVRQADAEFHERLPDIIVDGDEQVICTCWDDNNSKSGVLFNLGIVAEDFWGDALIGRIVIPLRKYGPRLLLGEHIRITQKMMLQAEDEGEAEMVVEFGFRPLDADDASDDGFEAVAGVYSERLREDYTKFM